MDNNEERKDIYVIPPNFMEGGSLFGGMVKMRNAIEAVILTSCIGLPVLRLPYSLTTIVIILCLTALPVALFALIGVGGESLSSFFLNLTVYAKNRRIVGKVQEEDLYKEDAEKNKILRFLSIFKKIDNKVIKAKPNSNVLHKKSRLKFSWIKATDQVSDYLPIKKIANGIIYTQDNRYVKIIEVAPINYLLRNAREQRNIIYSYIAFLKISPVKMQIKVISKRADINRHLNQVYREIENETDERCRALQEDYALLLRKIGSREAVSRRFFLIFEYEQAPGTRVKDVEADALNALQTTVRNAKSYLQQCGNVVLSHENDNEFLTELFYGLLNRRESVERSLKHRIKAMLAEADETKDVLTECDFIAPKQIDFRHGSYITVDGLYQSYLVIPSNGYKTHVMAGWISLLVNAGEGIDVDLFFHRQPKERIQSKLGQQIRINRSRIKEASDTNTDFDDLEGAIQSGYFLKNGLSNNEEFYYLNTMITVTADSLEELDWRVSELKKLLLSQDITITKCYFRQEQAFLSSLPLALLHKDLFKMSKRNALTLGVASCYPYTSYEMSDENGILLGVNKHNNSLIIVDIFNSMKYKNANMVILGTSGAGKTFLMQLMALRMRRKGIQVFIIAPLKGHEFLRGCKNIGGEFIQISPASAFCINVMEIHRRDNSVNELLDGGTIEKSELASKIQSLHIFFSLLIPDMSYEERQLLDEALIQTYKKKGITHDNDSLIDPDNPSQFKEMPVLGDLYDILLKNPDTKRMANILNRLVNGSARTFSQQTNVHLDNKYTVLDISELTGDMLTIGMFVVLDYVWDKTKEDRTVEKAVFIDECWKLMGASSNKLAAEYCLEVAKIIRGYGGSSIFSTQDLEDYFGLEGGKYGKGILSNAKTKIILNLEEEEAQSVKSTLHLSEAEIMAITHFERGSGLISTNNNNVTVEFKASELEKELITTDRKELQELARKKSLNYKLNEGTR